MRNWMKRIRGAIGVGLTWATGWGLFGGAWWAFRSWEVALAAGLTYAGIGFVGGATFAAVLRVTEGQRRFDELRIPRFAAWGALGGLLIGAGYVGVATIVWPGGAAAWGQFIAMTTLLGAGSAAGSLAIARLADDRELLEQGAKTAGTGLSGIEHPPLLGSPDQREVI